VPAQDRGEAVLPEAETEREPERIEPVQPAVRATRDVPKPPAYIPPERVRQALQQAAPAVPPKPADEPPPIAAATELDEEEPQIEERDLSPAMRLQASRAHRFRKRFGELEQQQ
jgi:hypothetical protein